jgi:hypothetical protein
MGWSARWKLRRFDPSNIRRIEVGRRTDYPTRYSFRGSGKYTFVVVKLIEEPEGPYYYAPLQRVAHGRDLVATLQAHPKLGPKTVLTEPDNG